MKPFLAFRNGMSMSDLDEPANYFPPESSGEELLFRRILEAAGNPMLPLGGLRTVAGELSARPADAATAEGQTRDERLQTLLLRGEPPAETGQEDPGFSENWITLAHPIEADPVVPSLLPETAEAKTHGWRRFVPRRRGLFLLVVVSGLAAVIINYKGCSI